MAENQNRAAREMASREKQSRPVYRPSGALPDPNPDSDWVYRWVATHVMGQPDPTNVSKKMREGWEPVKAADHPELLLTGNEKTGNVELGGLMLCKMPKDLAQSRDDYYLNQAQAQMESVENHFMRNNDPRMQLFSERKSSVTRGNGFGSGTK